MLEQLANAGSNLLSTAYDAHQTNKYSKRNMAFAERMASTQYQRAAKDLQKAGLNRVLALGGPAASPGASAAPIPSRKLDVMQAALMEQQISSAKAVENLTNEQARKTSAEADKEEITKGLYDVAKPTVDKLKNKASSAIDSIWPQDSPSETSGKGASRWKQSVDEIYQKLKKMSPAEKQELLRLHEGRKAGAEVLLPGIDY